MKGAPRHHSSSGDSVKPSKVSETMSSHGHPVDTNATSGPLKRSLSPKGARNRTIEHGKESPRGKKLPSPSRQVPKKRRVHLRVGTRNQPKVIPANNTPKKQVVSSTQTAQGYDGCRRDTTKGLPGLHNKKVKNTGAVGLESKETPPRRVDNPDATSEYLKVGVRLKKVSELSGRSVSRHFKEEDLVSNCIVELQPELVLALAFCSESNKRTSTKTCEKKITILKNRFADEPICSQLRVVTQEEYDNIRAQKKKDGGHLPRLLNKKILTAIDRAVRKNRAPGKEESGRKAEFRIMTLLEDVLNALKLKNIRITGNFSSDQHVIELRSVIDQKTHSYKPQTDAVIYEKIDENQNPLILFEAYSKSGGSKVKATSLGVICKIINLIGGKQEEEGEDEQEEAEVADAISCQR